MNKKAVREKSPRPEELEIKINNMVKELKQLQMLKKKD